LLATLQSKMLDKQSSDFGNFGKHYFMMKYFTFSDALKSRDDKDEQLFKICKVPKTTFIQIKIIEFWKIENPSNLTIKVTTEKQKFYLSFYNYKSQLLLQNGVFTFYIPETLRDHFTIPVVNEIDHLIRFSIEILCEGEATYDMKMYYVTNLLEESRYEYL
jgi:hypothetical protein